MPEYTPNTISVAMAYGVAGTVDSSSEYVTRMTRINPEHMKEFHRWVDVTKAEAVLAERERISRVIKHLIDVEERVHAQSAIEKAMQFTVISELTGLLTAVNPMVDDD